MPDPNVDSPAASAAASTQDPLSGLHKMSTTAGVSSQDYVAINIPAIASLILGLIGLVAVIDPILLAIPLAGVVCAVVSMQQIRNSNGTQSGRAIAWAGLLVSLGVFFMVGGKDVSGRMKTRADRQALTSLGAELGQKIAENKWDEAYALFSPQFQERITKEVFTLTWRRINENQFSGRILKSNSNDIFQFEDNPATGVKRAMTILIFSLEKSTNQPRMETAFRFVGGKWYIEDIPLLFTPQTPQEKQLALPRD
jgi:hypothetical protein